eukprot:10640577-Alexandrium_andersonii.AAC.1
MAQLLAPRGTDSSMLALATHAGSHGRRAEPPRPSTDILGSVMLGPPERSWTVYGRPPMRWVSGIGVGASCTWFYMSFPLASRVRAEEVRGRQRGSWRR